MGISPVTVMRDGVGAAEISSTENLKPNHVQRIPPLVQTQGTSILNDSIQVKSEMSRSIKKTKSLPKKILTDKCQADGEAVDNTVQVLFYSNELMSPCPSDSLIVKLEYQNDEISDQLNQVFKHPIEKVPDLLNQTADSEQHNNQVPRDCFSDEKEGCLNLTDTNTVNISDIPINNTDVNITIEKELKEMINTNVAEVLSVDIEPGDCDHDTTLELTKNQQEEHLDKTPSDSDDPETVKATFKQIASCGIFQEEDTTAVQLDLTISSNQQVEVEGQIALLWKTPLKEPRSDKNEFLQEVLEEEEIKPNNNEQEQIMAEHEILESEINSETQYNEREMYNPNPNSQELSISDLELDNSAVDRIDSELENDPEEAEPNTKVEKIDAEVPSNCNTLDEQPEDSERLDTLNIESQPENKIISESSCSDGEKADEAVEKMYASAPQIGAQDDQPLQNSGASEEEETTAMEQNKQDCKVEGQIALARGTTNKELSSNKDEEFLEEMPEDEQIKPNDVEESVSNDVSGETEYEQQQDSELNPCINKCNICPSNSQERDDSELTEQKDVSKEEQEDRPTHIHTHKQILIIAVATDTISTEDTVQEMVCISNEDDDKTHLVYGLEQEKISDDNVNEREDEKSRIQCHNSSSDDQESYEDDLILDYVAHDKNICGIAVPPTQEKVSFTNDQNILTKKTPEASSPVGEDIVDEVEENYYTTVENLPEVVLPGCESLTAI